MIARAACCQIVLVMRMMRRLHSVAGGEPDLDAAACAHIVKSLLVWEPGVANESKEQG